MFKGLFRSNSTGVGRQEGDIEVPISPTAFFKTQLFQITVTTEYQVEARQTTDEESRTSRC
jgi:hypothetical protein